MTTKIGIVGYGFVGRATAYLFGKNNDLAIYDNNPSARVDSLNRVRELKDLHGRDVVFVCVPTPMKPNGECDTSIVETVVKDVANYTSAVIVIRSTVPPGFTESMRQWSTTNGSDGSPIVFCPEFLTELNWQKDIERAHRVVVGGIEPWVSYVAMLFRSAYEHNRARSETTYWSQPDLLTMSSTEAEIGKLMTNGLLAAKVSFCNEVYALARGLGANYDKARQVATSDYRIGPSHTQVLGPDGKRGFGGTCLPKDLWNLRWAISRFMPPLVVDAALRSNELVRPEKDWEKLVGRAVVGADDHTESP